MERLQPVLAKGQIVLSKGRVLGQNALQHSQTLSSRYAAKIASGEAYETVLVRSKSLSSKLLSAGCRGVTKTEAFVTGPLRNAWLVSKSIFRTIATHQEWAPPSLSQWPAAKAAYAQGWERILSRHPLDYTWREVGRGARLFLDVFLFYWVGKAIGTGINRATL